MSPIEGEKEALEAAERARERRAALEDKGGPQTIAETVASKQSSKPRRGDLSSFFGPGMLPRGVVVPLPGAVPMCSRCGKAPCERNDATVAEGVKRVRYTGFCAGCRDLEFSLAWAKRMVDARKLIDPNARAREVQKLEDQRRAWTAKGRKCFT